MTATDKTLDLEEKEHLEWHGCDLPVVQVFRRTSRAVCTELAAYKRARPIWKHLSGLMCASQHGPTLWHLKTRVEVAWRSKLRMLSNDSNRQNVGFGRKRTS